jgi:hypothetical protein
MDTHVINTLEDVARGVQKIDTITQAIRSRKSYVKENYPKIQSDLRDLVDELQKNVRLIKRASEVLTHFRFAIVADAEAVKEVTRFNDYFIKATQDEQHIREHIDGLRTHCGKVRDHAERIVKGEDAEQAVTWLSQQDATTVFAIVGVRDPEKGYELGKKLFEMANEDDEFADSAEDMLRCLNDALNDVQNALGPPGRMYPENLPAAAALLGDYSTHFQKMEDRTAEAEMVIREFLREPA